MMGARRLLLLVLVSFRCLFVGVVNSQHPPCEVCGCNRCPLGYRVGEPTATIQVPDDFLEFSMNSSDVRCNVIENLGLSGRVRPDLCTDAFRLDPALRETCACPPLPPSLGPTGFAFPVTPVPQTASPTPINQAPFTPANETSTHPSSPPTGQPSRANQTSTHPSALPTELPSSIEPSMNMTNSTAEGYPSLSPFSSLAPSTAPTFVGLAARPAPRTTSFPTEQPSVLTKYSSMMKGKPEPESVPSESPSFIDASSPAPSFVRTSPSPTTGHRPRTDDRKCVTGKKCKKVSAKRQYKLMKEKSEKQTRSKMERSMTMKMKEKHKRSTAKTEKSAMTGMKMKERREKSRTKLMMSSMKRSLRN